MASWVIGFISSTGYWGILLLMFIENVFPPIPSEVIMPLAVFGAIGVFYVVRVMMHKGAKA